MTSDNLPLEIEKLAFEKEKWAREIAFKEKELALREKELTGGKIKATPAQVTIMVTLIGILGTLIVTLLQGASNQKLEKLKFESDLITKSVSSNDIDQNKKNLKFLLDAGFITDNGRKISALVNDTGFDLRIQKDELVSHPARISGVVKDENGNPVSGVMVEINMDASRAVISDKAGHYSILAAPLNGTKAAIQFSKSGYRTYMLHAAVSDQTIVEVMLSRLPPDR